MKIALDAMGGDFGPPNLVAGAVMALRDYHQIKKLYLVGDSAKIENELRKHKCNDSRIDIVHSTQVVEMSDRAWTAVRRKKDSSISRAVDLVKRGDADAVVSAGHTGAAVAASTIKFARCQGSTDPVSRRCFRPRFERFRFDRRRREHRCAPRTSSSICIHGHGLFHAMFCTTRIRRVGLVSLGDEDVKGNELTKEVFKMLKTRARLTFVGNIEGRHLFEDPVEVVVCDGFVGNVILKTCESISVAMFQMAQARAHAYTDAKSRRIISRGMPFGTIKAKTNYEEYGGSPLLGVNGICIIAHGASTPLAIKNALRVAAESIEQQVNPHIVEEIRRYHETTAPLEPALH